jgi:hypothetical protein
MQSGLAVVGGGIEQRYCQVNSQAWAGGSERKVMNIERIGLGYALLLAHRR